jgi:hypothetical protein
MTIKPASDICPVKNKGGARTPPSRPIGRSPERPKPASPEGPFYGHR